MAPPVKPRDVIRWLLRPLAEPSFLRLYLEYGVGDQLPRALFESTFFALSPDIERPDNAIKGAWEILAQWLPVELASPMTWYHRILKKLASPNTRINDAPILGDVRDLARYWSLPELFGGNDGDDKVRGYHEIHCHLRGAVPFLHLWRGFVTNARLRANLRKYRCNAGSWPLTWADLCRVAATQYSESYHAIDGSTWLRLLALAVRRFDGLEPATRYLAICTGLRCLLIHQRGKTGLSDFVASYNRYSNLQKVRGPAEQQLTRESVRVILKKFASQGATAIELRPTLDTKTADLRKKLRSIICGYFDYVHECAKDENVMVMGLVPSLLKQEVFCKKEDPSDAESDPAFWEAQSNRWLHQVRVLLDAMDDLPAFRYFVVGIDAAGKELGCPPRALARAFAEVRARTAQYALGRVRAGRAMSPAWMKRLVTEDIADGADPGNTAFERLDRAHIPSVRLGLTMHAGEDFNDPLTGLRHIWEAVHALDLWDGDRIGHAIAAALAKPLLMELLKRRAGARGTDVEKLRDDHFRIRKPQGTHLLDLAWAFDVAPTHADKQHYGTLLMQALGNSSGMMLDMERVARILLDEPMTLRPFFPGIRFHEPSKVHPEHWSWVHLDEHGIAAFESLRQRVLEMLVHKGIVVESCPTSNLAVANLVQPPIAELMNHSGLDCAIATDDPGVFDAWPQDELRLALRDKQRPDELRQRLLETNRRACFVRHVERRT